MATVNASIGFDMTGKNLLLQLTDGILKSKGTPNIVPANYSFSLVFDEKHKSDQSVKAQYLTLYSLDKGDITYSTKSIKVGSATLKIPVPTGGTIDNVSLLKFDSKADFQFSTQVAISDIQFDIGKLTTLILAKDVKGITALYEGLFKGDDYLIGSKYTDKLRGFGGDDIFLGNGGKDRLEGGGGNDTLNGGAGKDKILGGSGSDWASYNTAESRVVAKLDVKSTHRIESKDNKGDAKGDTYVSVENLQGSAFDDTLAGDGKNNKLDGGAGNDKLAGGNGADTFVFNSFASSTNVDKITDFSVREHDKIELSHQVFASAGTASGAGFKMADGDFFKSGLQSALDLNAKGAEILYNTKTGDLSYDADGAGAGLGVKFATLTTHPSALTFHDFLFTV